jgi:hypothetical protein
MASPIPDGMSVKEDIQRRIHELLTPIPEAARLGSVKAPEITGEIPPGRTGLVPYKIRKGVRKFVEGLNPVTQFIVESSPATLGTIIGAIMGGPFALTSATAGGAAGEFVGQETGIAPMDAFNLGVSAAGPAVGKGAGVALKGGRSLVGRGFLALPPAKKAMAETIMRKSVAELDSFGAKLLAKQRGLLHATSKKLSETLNKVAGSVDIRQLVNMNTMIGQVKKSALEPLNNAHPEAKALLKVIESVRAQLIKNNQKISFRGLRGVRKLLGTAIADFERAIGDKVVIGQNLRMAMHKDLEVLAKSAKSQRRGARLLQATIKRTRLEFSVRDFEETVASSLSEVPGRSAVRVDIGKIRTWLFDTTNPTSKNFNKNFTEDIGPDLPALKARLMELSRYGKPGSAAGAGSIVIRAGGARAGRALVGGLIGLSTGMGPIATMLGSLAGASIPEMMVAILMSRPGAALMLKAAKLGKGEISTRAWMMGGQIIAQSLDARSSEEIDRTN